MSAVRCFAGVTPDPTLRRTLASCRDSVTSVDPRWRDEKWVAFANLHLTLHFIGDVDESDLDTLTARLGQALDAHAPFELPFASVTASPNARSARMLWARFADPDGACERLAETVRRASEGFGESASHRAFAAHVTLCRARRPHALSHEAVAAATDLVTRNAPTMSVPSATLLASRLTPRGPVYTEIGMWRLRGD